MKRKADLPFFVDFVSMPPYLRAIVFLWFFDISYKVDCESGF